MQIRDRIKELRRVRAGDLRPNPRNWRTHPQAQQDALRGILAEVGYADALLARELPDGALEIVDGHLRAETTPEQLVPVLLLDVTEEEAALILASLDPLAAMAEADTDALGKLLHDVDSESEALRAMLDGLAGQHGIDAAPTSGSLSAETDLEIPESWGVLAQCEDEAAQQALYERLQKEGYTCRLLIL